jgi:diguanylate cyclase (GGDEF)-like protein
LVKITRDRQENIANLSKSKYDEMKQGEGDALVKNSVSRNIPTEVSTDTNLQTDDYALLKARILKLEESLISSEAKYQALITAVPNAVCRINKSGFFLDYKAGKEFPLLMPASQFIGKNIFCLLPNDIARLIMQHVEEALQCNTVQIFEYPIVVNDSVQYREARIVRYDHNEAIFVAHDVTDQKNLEAQLQYLNKFDALTGLYNRAFFEDAVRQLSAETSLGIIVCDIDGLKLINDTLGTQHGNTLLVAASNIIKASCDSDMVVARIDGDEFAILLSNNPQEDVAKTCRHIRQGLLRYNINNLDLPLSFSIGIATSGEPYSDAVELLKLAEDHMYREKLHCIQSMHSPVVRDVMETLESRYFMIEGPTVRMQNLVEGLAIALHIPEHRLAGLRLLARFHDIGTVEIPDHILSKDGPLTPDERAVMRQHCEIGHRIAHSIPDLVPIAEWILTHQEWWNGKGYPRGLKGEAIPLECRILAIADAYDAMTSNRPYRRALSHIEAVNELKRCAAVQFDPQLVDSFINIFENDIL